MAGITQVITALDGELPDLADPENFEAEANEFLTVKLPLLQTQLNVLRGEINTVSSAINAAISGGAFAIDYVFSTTTAAADPGPGYIRLNNATQNLATELYLDVLDAHGASWQAAIDLFDDSTSTIKGYLVVRGRSDGTKFLVLALTALATPSGYRSLTTTVAAYTSASPFANNEEVTVTFTPKGDKGDDGDPGIVDATTLASTIHAATGKTTPVDADELVLSDSADTWALKKLTWANIKATLKTYFDTLYAPISGGGSPPVLIATNTLSGQTNSAFTVGSTYPIYRIRFRNLVGSADFGLRLRVRQSGTDRSTAGDYEYFKENLTPGSGAVSIDSVSPQTYIVLTGAGAVDDVKGGVSGWIDIYSPNSATQEKKIEWNLLYYGGGSWVRERGNGAFKGNTTAIDGVNIYTDAGQTMTGGTMENIGVTI